MEKGTPENDMELEELDKPLPTHILAEIDAQDPLSSVPFGAEQPQQQLSAAASSSSTLRPTAYLDGLRGLAAFLVYVSHHIPWFYNSDDDILNGYGSHGNYYVAQLPFIRSFFTGGSAAVAIFFVLSGYVLSVSPLRMVRDGQLRKCYRGLMSAVVRRPFRLFIPPVGVSLVFALCMHLPFGLNPALEWPVPEANLVLELGHWLYEVLWMINPFTPHGIRHHWFPYNPPAWTMAIEFKGSMLVFFTIAIFSRAGSRVRLGLFMATGLILFHFYEWEMALFMAGTVLAINDLEGLDHALIPRQVSALGKSVLYHVSFFTGWYLLCQPAGTQDISIPLNTPGWGFLTSITPHRYYDEEYWRFWHNLGALMLVYGVLRISWLQKFFTTKTLRYMGKISFSFYLIHIPLLWTVGDRIYRIFGMKRQAFTTIWDFKLVVPDWGMHGLTTRFLVAQMFILPMCIVIADFSTAVLDETSINVGKWIVQRLGLAPDSPARR